VAFDLIDDMCNGRIKTVMGFWTRPGYQKVLRSLGEQMDATSDHNLYRTRGRIYMAIGDPDKAKADFDAYIAYDSTNARVYVNRAGTRFPQDMEGVISDCTRAIQLDPVNKNAWFLRGLARYEMGEKESACGDFTRAIDLGFEVLREAEQAKCAEFWDP
jgi:tetratricopeptide (TPR) repeat protein